MTALLLMLLLAQDLDAVPDPNAIPCDTDAQCEAKQGLGWICAERPAFDPLKACTPGCRKAAPRCPGATICKPWLKQLWRCQ